MSKGRNRKGAAGSEKGPRRPPASSTERSKATRIRQRIAAGRDVAPQDRRWLERYEAAKAARKLPPKAAGSEKGSRRPSAFSSTDRSRASRIRQRIAAGRDVAPQDRRWLERYEAAKAARKLPPAPPPLRARTSTERSKASRIRARVRAGTATAKDRAWLERYEAAKARAAHRRHARSKTARRRSMAGDAAELARRFGAWFGSHAQPEVTTERPKGKPGTATAVISTRWQISSRAETTRDALPAGQPMLEGGLSAPDRAMTVRVEITKSGTTRWATAVAYTGDTDNAEIDFVDAVEDIADSYGADGVTAVAVLVGT